MESYVILANLDSIHEARVAQYPVDKCRKDALADRY
jgi:hypothetical protein